MKVITLKNNLFKNLLLSILGLMAFENSESQPRADVTPSAPQGESRPAVSAEEIQPLKVGDAVPGVPAKNMEGDSIFLTEACREKPLILIFYRGGWCPYCNTQLGSLAEIQDTLLGMGFGVYGVSPDKPEFLKESSAKHGLKIKLLSDSRASLALAFGIAFRVDEATVEKYKKWNMDLERNSGESHHILPVPSVFMVDKQGKIRFSYSNADYKVRLEPDSLLAAARKFAP